MATPGIILNDQHKVQICIYTCKYIHKWLKVTVVSQIRNYYPELLNKWNLKPIPTTRKNYIFGNCIVTYTSPIFLKFNKYKTLHLG